MDCWMEVRPLLKVCKVQLLFWNGYVGSVTIGCSASCIRLTLRSTAGVNNTLIELVFPDDYSFQGGTITPPTENSMIRGRKASAEPLPCREVTFSVRFDNEHPGVASNAEYGLVAGEPYRFVCTNCSAQITVEDKVFRRVLPLPSEDWKEAACDWFCHRHAGTNVDGALSDVLAPRADELFTSARNMVVHDSLLGEAVKREAGNLRCGSCSATVGKKAAESSSALFATRVNVLSVGIGENGHIGGDTAAACLLSNFIKEHLEMSETCRMIFESETVGFCVYELRELLVPLFKECECQRTSGSLVPAAEESSCSGSYCPYLATGGNRSQGEQVLLLWLMETGLMLYSAEDLQPGQHAVELRVGSKVLYLETDTSDKVVEAWKDDALVGVHQLEPELLADARRMLSDSSPSTAMMWDRFRVAFLPGIVEQQ